MLRYAPVIPRSRGIIEAKTRKFQKKIQHHLDPKYNHQDE